MGDVTAILQAVNRDDPDAADKLLPLIYEELRQLAAAKMAKEKPGHTLQATALVHEVWLRLFSAGGQTFENRRHFFSAAAEAMRRILIENARRKQRIRHGGGMERVEIEQAYIPMESPDDKILAMNDAVDALTAMDTVKAEVVKLKYFVGLSNNEVAQALEISVATVERYWAYSKAWLLDHLRHQG